MPIELDSSTHVASFPWKERLQSFLSAYWLRPENAMWMTLRSAALSNVNWAGPSVDLSCGDGIFAFLHAGGSFSDDFDVFSKVTGLKKVSSEHVDMFDCHDAGYRPSIVAAPNWRVDIGTDLKPNMLARAECLGVYERLICHDNNQPLPFEASTLATVYCNSAYWVLDIEGFTRELRRVVRPDGRIVLHAKLAEMKEFMVERLCDRLGDVAVDILGRGRLSCWPGLLSRHGWEATFRRAGLVIEEETPFVTATHARMWDVGLRPIAPLLVRMCQAIDPGTRASIKSEWLELFESLITPLCTFDFAFGSDGAAPVEIQYVLRRA